MRLNYHHLFLFWTVAKEGSVARAGDKLKVSASGVSTQVHALEAALGVQLLQRRGRGVALTSHGVQAARLAEQIFALGDDLVEAARDRAPDQPTRFAVGVSPVVPKLVAARLLEPALLLGPALYVTCVQERLEDLLAKLSIRELDLVIADAPAPHGLNVTSFSHVLGESDVAVFAATAHARRHRGGFPRSLHGAPFYMPAAGSSLAHTLATWFHRHDVTPRIVGEVADTAMLKAVGAVGAGLFAAHSAVSAEVERQYQVRQVGRLDGVRERFYGISPERRLKHPAVLRVVRAGRHGGLL